MAEIITWIGGVPIVNPAEVADYVKRSLEYAAVALNPKDAILGTATIPASVLQDIDLETAAAIRRAGGGEREVNEARAVVQQTIDTFITPDNAWERFRKQVGTIAALVFVAIAAYATFEVLKLARSK